MKEIYKKLSAIQSELKVINAKMTTYQFANGLLMH